MAKIKVKDLAKELNLDVKELIQALKDLGIEVKTAASSLDEESAKIVKEVFKPKDQAAAPQPEPVEQKTPEQPIEKEAVELAKPTATANIPVLTVDHISVKDLAEKLNFRVSDVIKELMRKGMMATINQIISSSIAKEVAVILGQDLIIDIADESSAVKDAAQTSDSKTMQNRPPVVTIMGHVDHGKTKLLDAIRKTKVAEGEAGGITQHIGAYQVNVHGKKVTFLDTPGHEAFTNLRARGAKVTDIAILVVAADDGVKPQTIEAIDHAKAAGVQIIVAINKIDKPGANPDRARQQLSDLGLMPEEWGGKTVTVLTSAKDGKGVSDLLDMILLVAEVLELKADPKAPAEGVVIESRLDKGRGPVASLLVNNGTLKIGDVFAIGATSGKVRAMFTDNGKRLKEAGPATPIELLGCVDIPTAGDTLKVFSSDKEAREAAEKKQDLLQNKSMRNRMLSLEDFSKHIKQGELKELSLVLKADVQGSLDALTQSLHDLVVGNVRLNIIHEGVGQVTESDIMLAKASNAVVISFNIGTIGNAETLSQDEGIEIRQYNIIYKLLDDIKLAMEGLLEPEYEEVVTGHAEVRNLFKFSKVGAIAGSFVTDGKLVRGGKIRIFRGKEKIYEGKLESLKRFKDDVKSVEQNFECGIAISGYDDFKAGDVVEAFELREKARLK